jgi:hypothetical protein
MNIYVLISLRCVVHRLRKSVVSICCPGVPLYGGQHRINLSVTFYNFKIVKIRGLEPVRNQVVSLFRIFDQF